MIWTSVLVGYLLLGSWTVPVRLAPEGILYTHAQHTTSPSGLYVGMHDHSGGTIYIDGRLSWEEKANTLAHEYCHARQHYENREQNEGECER